jgi:hypothetical protein
MLDTYLKRDAEGFTAVLPQEGDSPVGTIVLHAVATHL